MEALGKREYFDEVTKAISEGKCDHGGVCPFAPVGVEMGHGCLEWEKCSKCTWLVDPYAAEEGCK